jgi:UDP-2,3-diacylglucosamine hydrolase
LHYIRYVTVFYLSDLHLTDGDSPAAIRLADFLHSRPVKGDTVILGGDVFDLFIGAKTVFRRKFALVLGAIRALDERGVEVYYLEGNHDFHVGEVFGGWEGVRVETGDFEIQADGARIYVSHGDLIDEEDRGYRLLRAITRSLPFQIFLRAIPGAIVDGLGKWSSRTSRRYNNAEKVDDARAQRLRALYLAFAHQQVAAGARHVLVGHSHLADQVTISVSGNRGEYLNLGFSSDVLLYAELPSGALAFERRSYPD